MRHIIAFVLGIILVSGCRDKIICPAFQSTYILDDSVRSVYYSYLWKIDKDERLKYLADRRPVPDTTAVIAGLTPEATDYFAYVEPYVVPPNPVNKSKFGIIKYEPYWLKNYELRTAPMENVLAPPPPVEEDTVVDVGEFVASDFSDSAALDPTIDSTAIAQQDSSASFDTTSFELPKIAQAKPPEMRTETTYLYRYDPKDKMLNVEQEYYNWYFGEYLVRTERVPVNPHPEGTVAESTLWDKVKEFFEFKWLFKKEGTASVDASVEGSVETEDTATEEAQPVDPPEDPPAEEAGQEEDPDDGF